MDDNFKFENYFQFSLMEKEIISYILILKNDFLCIGFYSNEIKIYSNINFEIYIHINAPDWTNNNLDSYRNNNIFIIELKNNYLLNLYNSSDLVLIKINYENFDYEQILRIKDINYDYFIQSVNNNFIYGINDVSISYIKILNDFDNKFIFEVISILSLDYGVEFFYEIPSKKIKEVFIKTLEFSKENINSYFYDSIQFKIISTLKDIYITRNRMRQIDQCPFIYYEKENFLGVLMNHDLIHFIDLKTHLIVYKYENWATIYPSIVYLYKLNNGKFFIVQYEKYCYGESSYIYLNELIPQNKNYYNFITTEIKPIYKFDSQIIFACFSHSENYFCIRKNNDSNNIIIYYKL